MTRYRIETWDEVEARWVAVDDPHDSMIGAELAIIELRKLGTGWDTGQYRVVPVDVAEQERSAA